LADELTCWMALHGVPGLGAMGLRRLIERFGSARDAVGEADERALREAGIIQPDVVRGVLDLDARLRWAERARSALDEAHVHAIRFTDPDYPDMLKQLHDGPAMIYVYGTLLPRDARAVAIVGSTRPSKRGRALSGGFAARLAREGCTIVSGYAHGIDSAAHRAALQVKGRTIFVVPHGIMRFKSRWGYPPAPALAEQGAVVSETPPEDEWSSRAAVMRNRLIAALSRAVIIIETRPRGGARHTAAAARKLGRTVFAVRYARPPAAARGNEVIFGQGGTPLGKYGDVDKVLAAVNGGRGRAPSPESNGTDAD